MIEANWGDTIQVTVNSKIENPEEGTTLHWHGLMQQNSQWEDGVPAVSQCPIAPGGSFTYSFRATPHGSTWYHSHYSSQYAGGLWGPLVIYGPETSSHDIDVGPVLLTDYFHRDYFDIVQDIEGTDLSKARPASDNNLINGKMNFDCSSNTLGGTCVDNAGLSKFNFTSGKSHRLRLVNAGVQGIQKFSIDNHTMTVIANDFIQVNPYNVTVVTLGVSLPKSSRLGPTDDCFRLANGPMSLSRVLATRGTSTGCGPCSLKELAPSLPTNRWRLQQSIIRMPMLRRHRIQRHQLLKRTRQIHAQTMGWRCRHTRYLSPTLQQRSIWPSMSA